MKNTRNMRRGVQSKCGFDGGSRAKTAACRTDKRPKCKCSGMTSRAAESVRFQYRFGKVSLPNGDQFRLTRKCLLRVTVMNQRFLRRVLPNYIGNYHQ